MRRALDTDGGRGVRDNYWGGRRRCALAQVQGLEQGRWHGQWVQLANATTAEFLHTSDAHIRLPKCTLEVTSCPPSEKSAFGAGERQPCFVMAKGPNI